MKPSLTVRRIAADQGAVLQELRGASLRDAPDAFSDPCGGLLDDAATFATAAARYAVSPDAGAFILYTEGHPAGLIHAGFEHAKYMEKEAHGDAQSAPSRRAFVSALWVAPAVRHLRGGELLVDTASAWLANARALRIYAWVPDTNLTAMRFYERLGFTTTGERARSPQGPDQWETLLARAAWPASSG